jgi:hypothetical protein
MLEYSEYENVREFGRKPERTALTQKRTRSSVTEYFEAEYEPAMDEMCAPVSEPEARHDRAYRKQKRAISKTQAAYDQRDERQAGANAERQPRHKHTSRMEVKAADLSNTARAKTGNESLTRMERKRAAQLSREEQRAGRRQSMLDSGRSSDREKTLYPAREPERQWNSNPRRALIIAGCALVFTVAILAFLMLSDDKPQFSGMQVQPTLISPTAAATDMQSETTAPADSASIAPVPTLNDVTSSPRLSPSPTLTVTPTPKPTATPKATPTPTPKPTAPPTPSWSTYPRR